MGDETNHVKISHTSAEAYDRKKTVAEGLLDVSLLLASATELKAVISNGPSHDYYIALLFLISVSIFIPLIVAIMLLIIGATEEKEDNKARLHKMNNATIGLILAVTVANIFVAAFWDRINQLISNDLTHEIKT